MGKTRDVALGVSLFAFISCQAEGGLTEPTGEHRLGPSAVGVEAALLLAGVALFRGELNVVQLDARRFQETPDILAGTIEIALSAQGDETATTRGVVDCLTVTQELNVPVPTAWASGSLLQTTGPPIENPFFLVGGRDSGVGLGPDAWTGLMFGDEPFDCENPPDFNAVPNARIHVQLVFEIDGD